MKRGRAASVSAANFCIRFGEKRCSTEKKYLEQLR
jgi:hypothetical protein